MTSKPNIIFILSDQQRWDTLGCYGQSLDVTPNLDKLARDGVKFEYAFTNQPLCGPARAIIQTGKYATQTGCFRNGIALSQNEKTIAHFLAEVGYEVGYVGKWHLASTSGLGLKDADYRCKPVPIEKRGGYRDFWVAADVLEFTSHAYDGYMFDAEMNRVDFPAGKYRADCVTDFAIEFLNKQKTDKPFLLFVSFVEPHHQNDKNCFQGPIGSKEKYADFKVCGDLLGTDGDWKQHYPDYLGCCNSVDKNVGRISGTLESNGLCDKTVIIYTSDHGSHFRTRNSEYKRSCHDSSIRIPLIIWGHGFSGGKTVDKLVSLIDLPPTMIQIAGRKKSEYMSGKPLQSIVSDGNNIWPEEVFVQISESQIGRAIRTKKWKYSIAAPKNHSTNNANSNINFEQFLYDLSNDPYEKNNLIHDSVFNKIKVLIQ
jgi:arylsulfatase A-like enzyme